jgi:hypothetical protein
MADLDGSQIIDWGDDQGGGALNTWPQPDRVLVNTTWFQNGIPVTGTFPIPDPNACTCKRFTKVVDTGPLAALEDSRLTSLVVETGFISDIECVGVRSMRGC